MAKTKKVSGGMKPEPNAPIIILRSDRIRLIFTPKVIEIDYRTCEVHQFDREKLSGGKSV